VLLSRGPLVTLLTQLKNIMVGGVISTDDLEGKCICGTLDPRLFLRAQSRFRSDRLSWLPPKREKQAAKT